MAAKDKAKHILFELKEHAPFTLLGAVLGIAFMVLLRNIGQSGSHILFAIFHPAHVVLSAMVTTALFRLHAPRKHLVLMILVGYFGSIGIATLSDILMPHIGAHIFGLDIPTETQIHQLIHADAVHEDARHIAEHHPRRIHFGFIDEWYLVNPAAFLGIIIAYFLPRSKFPHAGHVLISTWASVSYLMMDMEYRISPASIASVFIILFLSVWVPCCFSDIVFPLLFVKSELKLTGSCPICKRGGHLHIEEPHHKNH